MKILRWVAALGLLVLLHGCGGGGGSAGTSAFGGGGGGTGATTTPSMTIALSSNTVTTAASATVSAKILDANGNGVPDQVVSFTTSSLGVFNATTGLAATALTDASGIATVKLAPAPATAAGADSVVATATVAGTSLTASIGFQSAGGAATPTQAKSLEVLTSSNQFGTSGDSVTITATVKDAGNVSLASQPVTFTSNSGTISSASAATNESGIATAILTAGADKTNRTIVVTVASGAVTNSVSVDATGTVLSYSGVTTISFGSSANLTVKATDSKSVPVSGLSIKVSSSLGNTLSSPTLTTDNQGSASFNYTATKAGSDTLTFAGGGATTASTMTISGEDFVFVSPAANTLIPVGASRTVMVRYLSAGVPQVGKSVTFTATAGTVVGASATTDGSGVASATVTSTTASPATVQASLQGGLALATLPVSFVATTPASLALQVSPTAIGPNASGSTSQRAQLLATVRDANNNPVQGVVVNFTRLVDPSGGNLLQPSATTDGSGQASVQYLAGGLTTASNGVRFRATVASATSVFGDTSMTVNQSPLFIGLGTGNTLVEVDKQTDRQDWTVYVTDSIGAVVPNVNLTMKVLPVNYYKGQLVWNGVDHWDYGFTTTATTDTKVVTTTTTRSGTTTTQVTTTTTITVDTIPPTVTVTTASTTTTAPAAVPPPADGTTTSDTSTTATVPFLIAPSACPNEDINYSGVLNPGEDTNGDGKLEPGNVIFVSPSNVTTDASGRATVSLTYAKSYAKWIQVALQATAVVSGTESSNQTPPFVVSGLASDYSNKGVSPPGQESPFGVNSCTNPN